MLRLGRWNESMVAFQRAVAIDTGFAMAYRRLSGAASWSGDGGLALRAGVQAFERRDRMPLTQRTLIEAWHAESIAKDRLLAVLYG